MPKREQPAPHPFANDTPEQAEIRERLAALSALALKLAAEADLSLGIAMLDLLACGLKHRPMSAAEHPQQETK